MKRTVPAWKGLPYRYGLGLMEYPSDCGRLLGNGGDIPGFANVFQNSEDGTRQAAVIVTASAAPDAVGEPRNVAQQQALSDALGDDACG